MDFLGRSVSTINGRYRVFKRMITFVFAIVLALPISTLLNLTMFEPAAAANAPTISSVSPTSGPTAGGTNVTINGTGFFRGKDISQVSSGGEHTCAVASGKAYCWGNNGSGQLGNNSTTGSSTPVPVTTSGVLNNKTVTAISTSFNNTCAIADQRAYCWGSNTSGKLGDGSTTSSTVPVAVGGALANKNVTDISVSMGGDLTCAVADGEAYCWGSNAWRQLGIGTIDYNPHPNPLAVDTTGALGGKTVTAISTGDAHVCAVANAAAYCWGDNSAGGLGNGTVDPSSTPIAVDTSGVLNGKSITKISAQTATCVVANDKAYCWGNGQAGRIGNGTTTSVNPFPLAVDDSGALSGRTILDINSRGSLSCALADNTTFCWGNNATGAHGNGTTTDSSVPVATTGLNEPVTHLGSGDLHACAANTETIYCWGLNNTGQVGDGTSNNTRTSPVTTTLTAFASTSLPAISLGGTAATNITYVSASRLTATTPARSAGAVGVTVTNPDGKSATLPNSYTYLAPATVPSAPRSLVATPAENGVSLTWSAPSTNGGSSVTNYLVEYSSDSGSTWQTFTRPASATPSTTVTGLTTGTTYSFRVSAINSVGTGPISNVATNQPTYIQVTSSASVAMNVTPTPQSRTSSTSHTVSTSTNAPAGYKLSVSMVGADQSLANNGQTVGATSGTLTSPSTLGLNAWGFRVAGAGGFGSGAAVENNVATSAYTWAGVPPSTSPVTIKTTATAAQNNTTTILYGMRANTDKPSGAYSGSILYTAVTN